MSEYLRCLLAHGDAARVAAGRAPSGPNRLRGAETLLSALLCAGLTEREAVDAHLVLTTYVVGFALERQAAIASPPAVAVDDEFKAEYPTFASLAELASAGAAEHFRQGQTLVLDGIEARIVTASRRHGWRPEIQLARRAARWRSIRADLSNALSGGAQHPNGMRCSWSKEPKGSSTGGEGSSSNAELCHLVAEAAGQTASQFRRGPRPRGPLPCPRLPGCLVLVAPSGAAAGGPWPPGDRDDASMKGIRKGGWVTSEEDPLEVVRGRRRPSAEHLHSALLKRAP